jgi:hypothetical protein
MFRETDSKDKFDWDRYLESRELEAAPNFAFQHVSCVSLLSSMCVYFNNIFFLAVVTSHFLNHLGGQ